MDGKDKILLAQLEDKIEQCDQRYTATTSNFLDLNQRVVAEQFCRSRKGLRYQFYGGFPDAERSVAVFLPDYMEIKSDICDYFVENQEDNPLAVIRVKASDGGRPLTHRDYLGSLTGLGLKREMIGDILVGQNRADIIILKEIREFILFHYEKAGRTNLELAWAPMEELQIPEVQWQEKKDTVASLRLDNLIASAFGLSRGKAEEAIKSGSVFVNSRQSCKPDAQVKEGDKLVLRGKGKALLQTVGGQTRKDRIFITIQKYV